MTRLIACLTALSAALVCVGCKKDIQNQEAVRQGMQEYLSKRNDLMTMDFNIESVSFRQNEADARVHFQAKNTNVPSSGVSFNYVLERQGSRWVVKGRAGGGMAHGGDMIPQMPGVGAAPAAGALPPGHPAIPGHPRAVPQQ